MEPNNNKSILQWNYRGFRPNFEEIKNLISNFKTYILALQETHFKETDNVNIRGFDHYFKTCVSEVDGRATGGCSIFVKKGIPHEVLELDTELQAPGEMTWTLSMVIHGCPWITMDNHGYRFMVVHGLTMMLNGTMDSDSDHGHYGLRPWSPWTQTMDNVKHSDHGHQGLRPWTI